MPPTMSSHAAHTPQRVTPSSQNPSPAPSVSPSAGAAALLARQLKQMQQAKDLPGISCGLVDDNVFEWEVMLMISDDCRYYGGGFMLCSAPLCALYGLRLTSISTPGSTIFADSLLRFARAQAQTSPPASSSPPPTRSRPLA
jgi:hypothetical protein